MTLHDLRQDLRSGHISQHDFIALMHEKHSLLFDYANYLAETDISAIEVIDQGVILTERSSNLRFWCDPYDKRTAPIETLNFGTFESQDEQALYWAAQNNHVLLDIGANIGWYSLNLAKRMPTAQVYAFEPLPATFRYLQANARLNQITNLRLHNFGFADSEQEVTFYFNPDSTGSSSLADLNQSDRVQPVRCHVKRLDDFVADLGLRPDFIKCDVEGAEFLVFQGGREMLQTFQPVLFTEMLRKWAAKFDYHPNQIITLLHEIGYLCFASTAAGLKEIATVTEETVETNFVFLHRDKHAERIASLRSETVG